MSKAEKFIDLNTKTYSNVVSVKTPHGKEEMTEPWITPDQARKAVEIAREELIKKACRGYCDDICEKGICGMCYQKHDGKGQVKNTFKYDECNELQILINSMKNE